MKNTGVNRNLDSLGRIVMPKELRVLCYIETGSAVEFFTNDNEIIIRKYNPGCIICEEMENLKNFKEKKICLKCIEYIGNYSNLE